MTNKKVTPFKLKTSDKNKTSNTTIVNNVILEELSEKLKGMKEWASENYNLSAASGAFTVINELERWIKKKSK